MTRAELNAYIVANIYPNGNNEVTAPMVRDSALAIVAFIGDAGTYGVGGVVQGGTGLVTGGSVYSAINTALSSAIMFQGVTTTPLTDGSTNPNITIDGESYTAHRGDEVIYGGLEFLWTGSKWQQLGDEQSYALKTISISAGDGLAGGGNLTANRTISLSQDSLDKLTAAGTIASYFSGGKLGASHLPDLYLARTSVSETPANKIIYGVDGISHAAAADNTDKSRIVWDADNDAWHFYGNIYTDGWWSGRGVSPGGGGGGIDPAAMWSLLAAPTTEPINSTHISFPVTSVVGQQGAVSASQIASALGLGSLAYQSALTSAQVTSALGYTPANVTALAGYLPLAGGTMSNTNLVANLNADLIDGWNEGNFVGNNRGHLTDFNIAYSSSVHFIDPNCVNGPGAYYGQALIIHSDGDTTAQLAFPYSSTTGFLRVGRAFGAEWQNWREFAFLDSNVASATNATNADMLDGLHASGFLRNLGLNPYTYSSEISSQGTCTLNTGHPETPDSSYNTSYLTLGEYTLPRLKQLAFCYETDNIFYRRNAGNGWTSWVKLWNSSNSNLSTVDWSCSTLQAYGVVQSSCGYFYNTTPSLGYLNYGTCAVISTNNGGTRQPYGKFEWVDYMTGNAFIQTGRTDGGTSTYALCLNALGGNVGVKTTNPQYDFDVAGIIHASTGIWTEGYFSGRGLAQTSDERDKGGWRDITFTLADIVNAPAGSFAWLNGPGRSAGTTAQYWQKFTPELVGTKPDGKLSLEYGPLAFLIAKKDADEIYQLRKELNEAKGQIKELRARLGIAS